MLSITIQVTNGVFQGEILPLLIFIFFIKDIWDYFYKAGVKCINFNGKNDLLLLSYADDLVVSYDSPIDVKKKLQILSANL